MADVSTASGDGANVGADVGAGAGEGPTDGPVPKPKVQVEHEGRFIHELPV